MQCNSAMPDFIIAGEKVIIRKSPNHFQNTLLIGDSTFLPVIKQSVSLLSRMSDDSPCLHAPPKTLALNSEKAMNSDKNCSRLFPAIRGHD
jgi:hypothetical protein